MPTKAELEARVAELEAELEALRRRDHGTQCMAWLDQVPSVEKTWGSHYGRWIWDTPWGLFLADADGLPPAELIEIWLRRRQA